MGRTWTDEQKAEFGAKMKARREAKANEAPLPGQLDIEEEIPQTPPTVPQPIAIGTPAEKSDPEKDEMRRQIDELKDAMISFMSQNAKGTAQSGIGVGNGGKLLGEIEKYTIDPENYSDPTVRLRKEPRLQPLAFDYNYELDYEMTVRPYETKTGVNQKEPEFTVQLNRIVLDEEGNQTGKRYIAKRMVFHEDPQAALIIAREQGIDLSGYGDLDNTPENQKVFLNEMRYIRVRDWLFGVFWPKAAKKHDGIKEEVIGGSIVQVFTKSSEEPSGVDFDKITTILR